MMTYEILVEDTFTARHAVHMPDGTVEPAHTHNWRVVVRFVGLVLDECGLLIDFEAAKSDLHHVLREFEGADLNHCPAMQGLNPTAEHVARVIFDAILRKRDGDERLYRVMVTEAPGCTAGYGRHGDRLI
ncbi:MAG: 6-carboxytetrahydropterin synthase [Phycisphaerae bacterium]|nr:6-carboxytetrahydropterin synthase [Phycisphaerae bacterium]